MTINRGRNIDEIDAKALAVSVWHDDLYEFVKDFWSCVDSEQYIPNWVHEVICKTLQSVEEGKIDKLLINIPPGLAKSLICGVFYPAWIWIREPQMGMITGSNSSELAKRDMIKFYNLITHKKFQKYFGDRVVLSDGNSKKRKTSASFKRIDNVQMGYREMISTGAKTTGKRGKRIILDDPNDRQDCYSEKKRNSINEYVFNTLSTRNFAKLGGSLIIIQQRLHEDDVSGQAIQRGFAHLCLPMEYDGTSSIPLEGVEDPRSEGEFLIPAIFDEKSRDAKIKDLGAVEYATQYQQKPAPSEGNLCSKDWLIFSHKDETKFQWDKVSSPIISVDTNYKVTSNSDYAVCSVMFRVGPLRYICEINRGRLQYSELVGVVKSLYFKWSEIFNREVTIIIEEKANGRAIFESLQGEISTVKSITGSDTKVAKFSSVSPLLSSNSVVFLDNEYWTNYSAIKEEIVKEFLYFPNAKHDDIVDSVVQGLIELRSSDVNLNIYSSGVTLDDIKEKFKKTNYARELGLF